MKRDFKDLKVGNELDAIDVEAKPRLIREWTRTVFTLTFVVGCIGAIAIAAFGWVDEDQSNAVLRVWGALAGPLGVIIAHYYRVQRTSGERDD